MTSAVVGEEDEEVVGCIGVTMYKCLLRGYVPQRYNNLLTYKRWGKPFFVGRGA